MRADRPAPEIVSEGADPAVVGPYLAEHLGDEAWRRCRVGLVPGGKSNLTYLVEGEEEGREVILRRPPLGHVLPTAHDMVREFRVLDALEGTAVPVPTPLHLCEDGSVLGVDFYVMERCHGHVIRAAMPAGYAQSDGERRRIADTLVDNLVALHAVDWRAAGLEGFGRPQGFMERQIRRWTQQWERSQTRDLPQIDRLIAGLKARLPSSPAPTIVHGDYRLDNTMLDPDDPGRIVAILDWEMATIGDPLADIGLLCVYWVEEGDTQQREALGGIAPTAVKGFPSRAEVAARYGRSSGRDLRHLPFYCAFGYFKLAAVLEGIHARFLQGKTRGEGFEAVGERVLPLVELGLEALHGDEV
ncbi:MAG: phosphotransferase family protein [Actinomycetota bacterium]